MCPVCLATVGLYVAGGASAGGITTYWPPDCCADDAIDTPLMEGEQSDDEARDRDT